MAGGKAFSTYVVGPVGGLIGALPGGLFMVVAHTILCLFNLPHTTICAYRALFVTKRLGKQLLHEPLCDSRV